MKSKNVRRIMTYQEARDFISASNQYGSKLGLDAITELLKRLGNPQDKLKVIHVGGTNGKGSTSSFIATILSCQGYRVGRYHSPAVFDYLEIVQINSKSQTPEWVGKPITELGVSNTIAIIAPICQEMMRNGFPHPTSFEIETAMALLYLSWEQVDFAVIEVGLGGRLDATNVFSKPLCNVITSISMDHMQYLGDTVKEISYEKAGIIKKGAIVITSNTNHEVLEVLKRTCEKVGNTMILSDLKNVSEISYSFQQTSFSYQSQNFAISLLGEYQITNAILAIDTVNQLRQIGFEIEDRAIKEGLLHTVWGGRFEILSTKPYFIIDGAHNEEAALRLGTSIMQYFSNQKIIMILGVLADKDYTKILELTADLAEVILTVTPDNDRALASSQLAIEAKRFTKGTVIDGQTPQTAVKMAYDIASEQDVIIAFGSLSYLHNIRAALESSGRLFF